MRVNVYLLCTPLGLLAPDQIQCNNFVLEQAFSLAAGLLVYINVVFTLVLVGFLAAMPCVRRDDAKLSLWDYVKILAQMD